VNTEWIGAIWHAIFTALKWSLIWAAATNVIGKLAAIHAIINH
jgi:hypothetical protein